MDPASLLAHLAASPVPRIKRGQHSPSGALLGLLVCGLLHGYTSQHACWLWGRAHRDRIRAPPGFRRPTCPSYRTAPLDRSGRAPVSPRVGAPGAADWTSGAPGIIIGAMNRARRGYRGRPPCCAPGPA